MKEGRMSTSIQARTGPAQLNAMVGRLHQVIYNMLVTKDPDNKLCDCIDTRGETILSIAWVTKYYLHHTRKICHLQTHDIQPSINHLLASYNRYKSVAS